MSLADREGVEILERDECLRLLAACELGRVGIVEGNQPLILPVNYALDGETVVFRTGRGTKLDMGTRSPACFEIDDADPSARTGWSVLAVGRLEEVTAFDAQSLEAVQRLPVTPWAPGDRPHWMRLVPRRITGRRVVSRPERAG
jgi:uncharacterized protein